MIYVVTNEKIIIMRFLLAVLILIFSYQSFIKADQVSEFEIEGISVGDSLLDYATIDYINNNFGNWYDDEYRQILIDKKFIHYENVLVSFKTADKDYTIVAISGSINYGSKINECYKEQEKVDKIFLEIFYNAQRKVDILEKGSYGLENGDTNSKQIVYEFEGGNAIIECLDWDQIKKPDYKDRILISIENTEFSNWITKNS